MVKILGVVCCLIGLVSAQNFAPIVVQRPDNGRPFEPVSFRESVAKAIKDNLDRQKLSAEDSPNTNAQQNFLKFRPAASGNAIPRIRVPIVAKRPISQKIYREQVPIQEKIDEIQVSSTTRRPTSPPQPRVQNFQPDSFEPIVPRQPSVRQPIHTPIIPQTPQIYRKEEPRIRTSLEEEEEDQARSAQYSFSSNVDDRINDNQMSRSEARDGLAVTGMYSYSDGFFKRTVHYTADENGYRVTKEDIQPIGDGPQYNPDGSADVQSSLAGSYTITADDYKPSKRTQDERRRRL